MLHPKTSFSFSNYTTKYPFILILCTLALAEYLLGPGILQHGVTLVALIVIGTLLKLKISTRKNIYIVNFACYKHSSNMITRDELIAKFNQIFDEEAVSFHRKMFEKSGVMDNVYLPCSYDEFPPEFRFNGSRKEMETVVIGAIDALLRAESTPVDVVENVGILIVNTSTFNPTPSLSDTIVNYFKLRSDILSYDLGGMGCSASLIATDLAKQILQVKPNTYALVVSVESVINRFYSGQANKSMMLTNCLFRLGGAAILLSNNSSDRSCSKYQLKHVVRTHTGFEDSAFKCVHEEEDENGITGVKLSRDLMASASQSLRSNITTLGPLVLPISEQIRYLANLMQRKVLRMQMKAYVPNFKRAFEHFCVHAGGKGILDVMEERLGLTEWHIEPSRMSLFRFGNTSSSSIWYELAYSEAKGRIKENDRIWQIAFGSGFKCNSAVLCALKNSTCEIVEHGNPWIDEIEQFPVLIANSK
ncbi:hypothetical protein LIER_12442 [Lithospermum erythrorhizon]|uniref:3-ketoacyl-CoA synthase n=1 Tax=Lithospermum erythrorhizon TaxID=34254 RepID=A0AAV3PT87_LITER